MSWSLGFSDPACPPEPHRGTSTSRAILDAIKAEIREEMAKCDTSIDEAGRRREDMPRRADKLTGGWAGLHTALAIIERHEKEKGSE